MAGRPSISGLATGLRGGSSLIRSGLLGDHKSVGDGVSEIRIDEGPGYRLYFARRGMSIVVLLCGGDKGSQSHDIVRAKALARTV